MALFSQIQELGVADVDLFECQATLEGAVHTLHFHNKHTATIVLTVKFYDHSEGTTKNIIVKSIPAGEEYVFLKTLDVNAGDKIIAASNFTTSVMATISAYTNAATPATTGLTPKGAWSSIVNYIADRLGTSYIAINPNSNDPPPSANWMVNSAQGPEGTGDFMKDGSVPMTGNLNLGANNIIITGTVAGRNVAADGAKLDAIPSVNKYNATAAPTANDDSADTSGNGAFSVGSRWADVTNDEFWMCADDTATAAVWKNLSLAVSELGSGALLDEMTEAQYQNNTVDKLLSTDKVWSAAANVALTSSTSIEIDFDAGFNYNLTLAHNATFTIAAGSATKVGQSGRIAITQDGTGSRTILFGTGFTAANNSTFPEIDSGISKKSYLYYEIETSGEVHIAGSKKDIA